MSGSTLTKQQREAALREVDKAYLDAEGNATAAARLVGLVQQTYERARKDRQIGIEVVRRMATKLRRPIAGIDPEESDGAPVRVVETEERYPSRAAVLAGAKAGGDDPRAIASTASEGWKSDVDPGPAHWRERLVWWVDFWSEPAATLEPMSDEDLVAATVVPKRKRKR